jgi:hypothetical protein
MEKYKVSNINDLSLVYYILLETYPENVIDIIYSWEKKEYILSVNKQKKRPKASKKEPLVDIDLSVRVIYGDSVTEDTPLFLRINGKIQVKYISELVENEDDYFQLFDKLEYSFKDKLHIECWTHEGWKTIKRVIKHETTKDIYRIITDKGSVDITSDHSLLTTGFDQIKPTEYCNKTELLCTSTTILENVNDKENLVSNKYAFLLGFLLANTTINKNEDYCCILFKENEINEQSIDILESCLFGLCEYNIETEWENDTASEYPCSVYEYMTFGNKSYEVTIFLTEELVQLVSNDSFPDSVFRYDTEQLNAFIRGMMFLKGPVFPKNKLHACAFHYIFNCSLNETDFFYDPVDNAIKQIGYLWGTASSCNRISTGSKNWVYDLETECGSFNAGIGQIMLKNTDSIFIEMKYNRDDYILNRELTFELSEVCASECTRMINAKPMRLCFEKVIQPFILLTKKRYAGNKYEEPKNPHKLTQLIYKGVALTRRNYCQMVKDCYQSILDTILNSNDNSSIIDTSITFYKMYVNKIQRYDIPIKDLVLSARLAKEYKTVPVHYILAKKLKERKQEVRIGERVQYIFIEDTTGKKLKKTELGENPEYAIEHSLKFNRLCYLEQLYKPIMGMFKVIIKDMNKFESILQFTNERLIEFDGKKIKMSDLKIHESNTVLE